MHGAVRFLLFSGLGWAIENMTASGPRYSRLFGGLKVPLLPIYGVGGILLEQVRGAVAGQGLAIRVAAYASSFTALEYLACKGEQKLLGSSSWGYGADGQQCVDLPHALAWGALGLAAERL